MNIPEEFRPAALQVMSFDHPIATDFINWPSIRDQLIFKAGKYDLDRMVHDMVSIRSLIFRSSVCLSTSMICS